jgi:cellulose synthase/poly-beta-1,6-N-acetylglucosamine synthase-like glycosyltransferase
MIDELVSDGFNYLSAQSLASMISLFWLVIIFEAPRYFFSFIAAAFFLNRPAYPPLSAGVKVSMIIAGHNEADSVERCVRSLREQSRPPDEIIVVSDGSTDRMREKLRALMHRGLIDQAHCTDLRAGKSAGANLAWRFASGDILVNVDCDCSFDRDAIKNLIAPFGDKRVGAVCGNIFVRNQRRTTLTAFQAIEYLISISLGKQAASLIDQVTCVSGAFGAFRRDAFASVCGLDSGGGEDLDITLKLRRRNWKIRYASDSICYTDVPATPLALVRQRLRWERDAIRLRYRKHRGLLNPFSQRFNILEAAHEAEFLFFNVAGAAALPIYFVWLFATYGEFAPAILICAQAGLFILDFAALALAAWATPKAKALPLAMFLPGYALFYGVIMRFLRLFAYAQEWIFKASYKDSYVP